MQQVLKKKAQEHTELRRQKLDSERRKKEKISKQIAAVTLREEVKSPGEKFQKENKNGFELAGQVMMHRTKSHVNLGHDSFFRDDLSIGKKSAIMEDPMVAQAKERE